MNYIKHFKTVGEHRKLVRQGCFRLGLFKQGLLHDLSKYSPTEFLVGAKYYQGFRSPNNAEREDRGYSAAWLHHKGRNKHHYEYWMDYSAVDVGGWLPAKMPNRYLAEMFADRVAASTTYNKDKYTDDMPLKYFLKGKEHAIIHPETKAELEKILTILANEGQDKAESYIRRHLLWNLPLTRITDHVITYRNKRAKI